MPSVILPLLVTTFQGVDRKTAVISNVPINVGETPHTYTLTRTHDNCLMVGLYLRWRLPLVRLVFNSPSHHETAGTYRSALILSIGNAAPFPHVTSRSCTCLQIGTDGMDAFWTGIIMITIGNFFLTSFRCCLVFDGVCSVVLVYQKAHKGAYYTV